MKATLSSILNLLDKNCFRNEQHVLFSACAQDMKKPASQPMISLLDINS